MTEENEIRSLDEERPGIPGEIEQEVNDQQEYVEGEEIEENENENDENDAENEMDKPTAFILDDDRGVRSLVSQHLESWGINHYEAADIDEAVEKYKELKSKYIRIDVLYLDLYLPNDKTGFLFLDKVRGDGWLDDTYILVMSSCNDEKYVEKMFFSYHVNDFVQKPIKDINFQKHRINLHNHLEKQLGKFPELPGYKFIKTLGSGKSAVVYLAKNINDKKPRAIKVIKREQNLIMKGMRALKDSSNDINLVEELSEALEVKYLKDLRAPTIIRLYESKIIDNNEFIVLEYAEYGTLSKRIAKYREEGKKFSTEQILDWMTEVFIGLFRIHTKEVMHRDIKSENLFLCANNVVKIGDLGIAKNASLGQTSCGTVEYNAPEIFFLQEYSYDIDIWAAGVVLYELITLQKPFTGTVDELKEQVVSENYKPIPENTNSNLKRLLKLTLAQKENRANAGEILSLKFIRDRIDYLCENKIIEIDANLYSKIKEINVKKNSEKFSFEKDYQKTLIKEYDYYKCFHDAQLIYYKFKRTQIYSWFYLKMDEVIQKKELFKHGEDYNITKEGIEDLQELGILVPYDVKKDNNKNDKKEYDFYTLRRNKNPDIDNDLNFPINEDWYDCFYLEPLETSVEVLKKAINVFKIFRNILEDEEIDDEEKYNFICCEEVFEFLTTIKKLRYIKINKCSNDEKTAILLNIYQTMLYHYIVKCVMFDYELNEKTDLSFLQNILASLRLGKFYVTIKYMIAGHILTISDVKKIVFRENYPSPFHFLPPKKEENEYSHNPNMNNTFNFKSIEEKAFENKMKILAVCLDPPNIFDDNDVPELLEPIGICFTSNSLQYDLDNSFSFFVQDNIWIDDTAVHVPKFFKDYLYELGVDEKKMIGYLIKVYYHESYLKHQYINTVLGLSRKKIYVNYYDLYKNINN